MTNKMNKTYETEVVVVGSGPGGATVARELSKRGKQVILCEAGNNYNKLGKFYSPGKMLEKGGMTFSEDGLLLNIGKTMGGQSMVYAATAVKPPPYFKEKYGIDLKEELDELYKEIPIQPLPDNLVGPGARLMMESAKALGMDWQPLDKLIRPDKCVPGCGGCTLGCTTGAKWTAREFVNDAVENGAALLLQTQIEKVVTEGGKAVGVVGKGPGGDIMIKADKVVMSAGGAVSPVILKRSGIEDAGDGFMADPVLFVWGLAPEYGNMKDVPLTAGIHMREEGLLLMDICFPPLIVFGTMLYSGVKGLLYLRKAMRHQKIMAVMVKAKDEFHGQVKADGTVSKPLDDDVWKKLNKGIGIAEEILLKSGVKLKDIFASKPLGGHPGGTVRIGKHLDNNCQTEIKNCYCLDNSIIPEPFGQPPTVTLISMGKRLAKHLTRDA